MMSPEVCELVCKNLLIVLSLKKVEQAINYYLVYI